MADTDGGKGRGEAELPTKRIISWHWKLAVSVAAGESATSFHIASAESIDISRPRCVTWFFRGAEQCWAKKRGTNVGREKFVVRRGEGRSLKDRIRIEKIKNCGRGGEEDFIDFITAWFDGTVNNRYRLATGNSLIYGRIGNRGGQTQRLTLKYFIQGS